MYAWEFARWMLIFIGTTGSAIGFCGLSADLEGKLSPKKRLLLCAIASGTLFTLVAAIIEFTSGHVWIGAALLSLVLGSIVYVANGGPNDEFKSGKEIRSRSY